MCVFVCGPLTALSSPGLLQRVIARSSTTNSKVSTADGSNNADPPLVSPPLLPLLWLLYIDLKPQVYLCLRHPIISLWRCRKKVPWSRGLGNCVTVEYSASPKFPLPLTKTVRKLGKETINQTGIGYFKGQVVIGLNKAHPCAFCRNVSSETECFCLFVSVTMYELCVSQCVCDERGWI